MRSSICFYKKNARADLWNHEHDTPLHIAAGINNVTIVQRLLDSKGVSVHVENHNGETPLYTAVSQSACDVIPILIEKGAELEDNIGPKKGTLLHLAISSGGNCVETLLRGGANVNALNEDNETPLYVAAKENMKDEVKLLLEFNAKRSIGRDPMNVATPDTRMLLDGETKGMFFPWTKNTL